MIYASLYLMTKRHFILVLLLLLAVEFIPVFGQGQDLLNEPAGSCYDNREIRVESLAKDITIAGTLSLPRSKGPHPAVHMTAQNAAGDCQ
jgi:hypothetical protein